ncbi:MAG: NUDIX hydrolase N-terminal domain-containing protein [Acidimicrobiales bacterium]
MNEPVRNDELLRWSEALAGIARTGLGFTTNPYERERFEEVLAVAADMQSRSSGSAVEADAFVGEWMKTVGTGIAGYVTPKVAVGAVVGDDAGRLLLIQRSDSGVWLYPTGWADVGYSPAEVAMKEVFEETGIRCEVIEPLAIHDGLRLGFSRIPLYSIVFLCRAVGGSLRHHPQECLDAGWFHRSELPSPVASFERWGDIAYAAISGEPFTAQFDAPRHPVWRGGDH